MSVETECHLLLTRRRPTDKRLTEHRNEDHSFASMATDNGSMVSEMSIATVDTVHVRGGDTPDLARTIGKDALKSWGNVEDLTSDNPAESPTKENKRKYWPLLDDGRVIGHIYAIILALLGVAFPVKEALQDSWLSSAVIGIFLVYLYVLSFACFVCLEFYQNRLHTKQATNQRPSGIDIDPTHELNLGFNNLGFKSDVVPSPNGRCRALSRQPSCASESEVRIRESDQIEEEHSPHRTSIYTRIGAVIFGLGFLVYDGLLLKQLHDKQSLATCRGGNSNFLWTHYLHILFHLAQTYFIFKHPQVRVEKLRPLAKIGFMHVIATNWCVWVRAVVRETFEATLVDKYDLNSQSGEWNSSALEACNFSSDKKMYNATPYLFPFVVQYSLLALIALYSMYSDLDWRPQVSFPFSASMQSPPWTEINFHRTHRGIFFGMITLGGSCVAIILFFAYLKDDDNDLSLRLYHTTGIVMLCLLGAAITTAWAKIRMLGFRRRKDFPLNCLILLGSLVAALLFSIFRIMAVADQLSDGTASRRSTATLLLFECLVSMLQPVVQTGFIVDGMCRYTTTDAELQSKPGRGCITFLLCGNVAMWIFRTVQMKEIETEGVVGTQAYGIPAWEIIVHVLLPLLMYYHFHSTVCLASIWYSAYQLPLWNNTVACPNVVTLVHTTIARRSLGGDDDINSEGQRPDQLDSSVDSRSSPPNTDSLPTAYSSLSTPNKRLSWTQDNTLVQRSTRTSVIEDDDIMSDEQPPEQMDSSVDSSHSAPNSDSLPTVYSSSSTPNKRLGWTQDITLVHSTTARTSVVEDDDIESDDQTPDQLDASVDTSHSAPNSDSLPTVYRSLSTLSKRGDFDADVEGLPVSDV